MITEDDAEHVKAFALHPVRTAPNVHCGFDAGIILRHGSTHAQTMLLRRGEKLVDHVETRLAAERGIINGGKV